MRFAMLRTGSALIVLMALSLVGTPLAAQAACRDDAKELDARLANAPPKAPNVVAAKAELAKLAKAKLGESECDNVVARAWRAYKKAPPEEAPQEAEVP